MEKIDLIAKIKSDYANHKNVEKIISCINEDWIDDDDKVSILTGIARMIFIHLEDSEYSKEIILNEALQLCSHFYDYERVSCDLSRINCFEEGKKVAFDALEKYPLSEYYRVIAYNMAGNPNCNFDEPELSLKLFKEASRIAETADDFSLLANSYYNSRLNDKYNPTEENNKFIVDNYLLALHLEDDKDEKKYIKDDMKGCGIKLSAKEIKDRTALLVKERNL